MEKLKSIGEVCFGPLAARKFEGQKGFDKYYIDRSIKQVVKKTGEGEDEFIIVDKVIVNKRDIDQVIKAQASEAGIEAYLKTYEVIGESVPDVKVTDDIQDFTGMPNSLAEAALLGEKSRKMFQSLPAELKGKMSYEDFMTSFSQSMFDAFVDSLKPKIEEKKEG